MADDWLLYSARRDLADRDKAARIDATVPNAARVGDYLDGGRDNFEADRRAVQILVAASPVAAVIVPVMRAFHQRVMRFLTGEAGIRQFLDTGVGLAATGNTHQLAQSMAPDCRVVYVDDDPMVLAHARAMVASAPDGTVASLEANLSDPGTILAGAAKTLDFGRPVAILLIATLGYVVSDATAAEVMRSLVGAVPAGSYVALCHQASDLDPEMIAVARRWNAMSAQRIALRGRAQLTGLLAGLDPVPPGLVRAADWRPAPDDARFELAAPVHGVVARKP